MKIRTIFVTTRVVSWGRWFRPLFRKNVYDNAYEHLVYFYIGKFNIIWGWEK